MVETAEHGAGDPTPEVERKVLNLVGLGMRARNVVVGVDRVKEAVKKGKVILAIVAPDASHHSREKVLPLLSARHVRTWEGSTAAALGAAVGKETTAVVGITDSALAAGVRKLLFPAASVARQPGSGRTR